MTVRPFYLGDEQPPDEDRCPICGSLLNAQGECMDWRQHDDPTNSYRDES